jgi:hypothetical protein
MLVSPCLYRMFTALLALTLPLFIIHVWRFGTD